MKPTRLNELDLLRFLAAMSVVLFHYTFRGYAADGLSIMPYLALTPISKYGYLGVDLFFMISGFVIFMTIAKGSLKTFFISRISRLYPAFWTGCTLTFIVALMIGGTTYATSFVQYLINLTMMSGFVGVAPVDGVYWSLFVELKFYVLIALILLIKKIQSAETFLLFWLLAIGTLDVFPNTMFRSVLIADYGPCFIGGSICYLIYSKGLSITTGLIFLSSLVLGLSHSLALADILETHYRANFNPAIVLIIVSIQFMTMFLVSLGKTQFIGKRNWITVGAISYPLYLIHQHIGYMIFNAAYPAVNPHVLLWGTVLLVIGVSYFITDKIERRYTPRLKQRLELVFEKIDNHLTNAG